MAVNCLPLGKCCLRESAVNCCWGYFDIFEVCEKKMKVRRVVSLFFKHLELTILLPTIINYWTNPTHLGWLGGIELELGSALFFKVLC
jgi:hypothetical protein